MEIRRAKFEKDQQKAYLLQVLAKKKMNTSEYARVLRVHPRSLSDWIRERYSLPLRVLQKIQKDSKIHPPKFETKERYWYVEMAARIGGTKHLRKYRFLPGYEKKRREKWFEWWKKKGQFKQTSWFLKRPVHAPAESARLAEFIGIMIGDGGISERQVKVTLNNKDDAEYMEYVANLMQSLFKTNVSKIPHKDATATNITISRTSLVDFCIKIGLKRGNKLEQGLDIPRWIRRKPAYQKTCLRGIMDTDGCVFQECHEIRGRRYCYPRLQITSASSTLRESLATILHGFEFSPRIRNNRCVSLERREDIIRYFKFIGSSNPKHLRRFERFKGEESDNGHSNSLENYRLKGLVGSSPTSSAS